MPLFNVLYGSDIQIVLCSGRNEEHRPETVNWLAEHELNSPELRLRQDGDYRSEVDVKREMLAGLDKSKILFVMEDRGQVVERWRSEGLVALQCAPGEF